MTLDFWLRPNGTIASSRRDSPLAGRTPAELVIMAETRKLLQTVLSNSRIKASAPLRNAISTALRTRRKFTAPLIPLSPEHRLGWLDEVNELTCAAPLADAFSTGLTYKIASRTVATLDCIQRQTLAGLPEDVLVSGTELLISARDDSQRIHIFAHHPPPPDPRIHATHPLTTLLDHFHIPPVPDIAALFPARFQKLKNQLAAL